MLFRIQLFANLRKGSKLTFGGKNYFPSLCTLKGKRDWAELFYCLNRDKTTVFECGRKGSYGSMLYDFFKAQKFGTLITCLCEILC